MISLTFKFWEESLLKLNIYILLPQVISKVVTKCTGRISYRVRAWMSKNSSFIILYLEAEKIKLTCIGDRGSLEAQIFKVGSLREH